MEHEIVSREKWLEARAALMAKEKAVLKAYDQLGAEQRALPWTGIENDYVFQGPSGPVSLSGLFDGKSQLFTKTFMLAPGRDAPMRGLLAGGGPYGRSSGASEQQ